MTTLPNTLPFPRRWLEPLQRFVCLASGKLRRFDLVHRRPAYLAAVRDQRDGTCRRCGRCCNLGFRCPAYAGDGRCLTYAFGRPKACAAFPIDERDLADIAAAGGRCGYRFSRTRPSLQAPEEARP